VSEVTADRLLELARSRIERLSPGDAWSALRAGEALMIDIRSTDARAQDGVVPGSVHIPRTVLEWRLDPQCEWRNPHAAGTDRRIVLVCDHGYSSSLAAAGLVDLGYTGATDVEGGIDAWRRAGLPLAAAADAILAPGELPGMRGPTSS
jgi:rhodanese-related sulfurtransferase